MKPAFMKLAVEYFIVHATLANEVGPAQSLRFQFPRHYKLELQTMPMVIWIKT
jgi:hypothetical protein